MWASEKPQKVLREYIAFILESFPQTSKSKPGMQVPGNSAAVKQHFNVVSERYITFDGIVKAVASALGKEAKIVHYNPDEIGLKKGEGFPFRTGHFFASAEKAKRELGWGAQHSFLEDVADLVQAYKDSGRQDKDIDFSTDDKILSKAGWLRSRATNRMYWTTRLQHPAHIFGYSI